MKNSLFAMLPRIWREVFAALLFSLALGASPVSAVPISPGDAVSIEGGILTPGFNPVREDFFTVGAGIDFSFAPGASFTYDMNAGINGDEFLFVSPNNTGQGIFFNPFPEYLILKNLDFVGGVPLVGFELFDTGVLQNLSVLSTTSNSVTIRWDSGNAGSSYAAGDTLIAGRFLTEVSAVPLPAALPLFGSGLAVLGFLGWRRKRKVAQAA